jgi:hypothetical protein
MSSTNRSRKAVESRFINRDYYVTPVEEIKKFLVKFKELEPSAFTGTILDPCAGGDKDHLMSYPLVLEPYQVMTMDIREDSLARLKCNYLQTDLYFAPDVIITNPPFHLAQPIIQKALKDVKDGGFVIMLLRVNFLGSKGRLNFWQKNMPKYMIVHSERMSFLDSGATDSIEYAHFVWQKGYNGNSTFCVI